MLRTAATLGGVALALALAGCSSAPPPQPDAEDPPVRCLYVVGNNAYGNPQAPDFVASQLPSTWKKSERVPRTEEEALSMLDGADAGRLVFLKLDYEESLTPYENIPMKVCMIPIIGWCMYPFHDAHLSYEVTPKCAVQSIYPTSSDQGDSTEEKATRHAEREEEKPKAIRNALRVALTNAEKTLGEKAKPLTKEGITERKRELAAAPALQALREADENLAGGRVPQAFESVGKAEALAKQSNLPDVNKKVTTAKEKVRAALVDYYVEHVPGEAANGEFDNAVTHYNWLTKNAPENRRPEIAKLKEQVYTNAMTAIREKLLPQDRVEDARAGTNALASLVGDNDEKLAALRSEIATKAKTVAAALADKAGTMKGFQCFEAEPLLKRALALDPANENAKGLLEVVQKNIAELTPTYVKDVHAQVEGDGYLVWFTVANAKGEMVPAPGKVDVFLKEVCTSTVEYNQYANKQNEVELPLNSFSEDVSFDSYKEMEVGVGGVGGKRLMHICKRVPFSGLKQYDQMARTMYSVGTPLYTSVKVQFTPSRGETLVGTGKAALPR